MIGERLNSEWIDRPLEHRDGTEPPGLYMPKSIQTRNWSFHRKTETSPERIKSTSVHVYEFFSNVLVPFFWPIGRSSATLRLLHHPLHLGQLLLSVHAHRLGDVEQAGRPDRSPRSFEDLGAIGQVVLRLRIVGPDLIESVKQRGAIEREAAGIDLGDGSLFG